MAQEKILGKQLNITTVADEIAADPAAAAALAAGINLDDLNNVSAGSPSSGQVLTYSNSPAGWSAQTPTGGVTNPMTANLDTGGYVIRAADFASGDGVPLVLRGGYSTNTNNRSFPSNVSINGGNSLYAPGGNVTIDGGESSTKPAGDITITGGYSSGYSGGIVALIGGESAADGYSKGSGNARVYGGQSTGVGTPAGDVVISGGKATGTGSPQYGATGGNVKIIPGYGIDGNGTTTIHPAENPIGTRTGEGILRIVRESNSSIDGSVGLTVPSSTATDIVFTLPNTDGINGDVLQTDGIGNLTFATPSGGGSNNWLTANNGIDFSKGPYASTGAIALGDSTSTYGDNAIAIGNAAYAGTPGSPIAPSMAIALGYSASATLTPAIALGSYATVSGNYSTGIGISATVSGNYSTGIGITTVVSGNYSIAVCNGGTTAHSSCSSFGLYCYSGADYQTNVGYGVSGDAVQKRTTLGFGNNNPVGAGTGQSLVTIYDGGKVEPIGDTAMFVAPTYTLATLPPAVVGGMIYVTDATTGVGSPLTDTGVQCFGRGTGSPAIWIDVITGLAVA